MLPLKTWLPSRRPASPMHRNSRRSYFTLATGFRHPADGRLQVFDPNLLRGRIMRSLQPSSRPCVVIGVSIILLGAVSRAQDKPKPSSGETPAIAARITRAVDEKNLVVLKGNVHPLARPEYDHGVAPLDLPMERRLLVLKRRPEQKSALLKVLDDQQDKFSPRYRHWLTPEQFGHQFEPSYTDIQKSTDCSLQHHFQ